MKPIERRAVVARRLLLKGVCMSLDDSDIALLRTRRTTVLTQLAAMTSSSIGGMPNTSGGESLDHQGYKSQLYAELQQLNEMLAAAECYEIIT